MNNYSERSSKLLIVPWYNKKEWLETYHQIYSDNVELQAKSYTQMCIWKARYPNLPLGVECTMSMLHVRLCDKQESDESTPIFENKDLQLLYSTAVMRFLNHLSVMSNCKDSMYKMAKQQKIPDWLINLRHEAAHGNSLPALYLLRQASDIIMQWLKTHYWETEAEVMEDSFTDRKTNREYDHSKIVELLDLWLVLKINYWSGKKIIGNIHNEDVRKKAMDLASEEGLGLKNSTELPMKKGVKKMKKSQEMSVCVELASNKRTDTQGEYTHKIKTAFDPLLRKLFGQLKEKKHKKSWYQECLIECLVNYQGFCPQIDLEKLTEMQVLELMSLQGDLWKEVVEELQTHSLLSLLMSALLVKQEVQEMSSAHLWLRLFTHLLSGDAPLQPPGTQELCRLLADSLPCDVDPQVLLRKANLHHVKHQRPLELKPASVKEVDVLRDLAHKVLAHPTNFTSKYLESLLTFWETPLKADTKKDLCDLVNIYNGQKIHKIRQNKVFTVASLLDHGFVIKQSKILLPEENIEDISSWKLYSGDVDWSQCALGTLPF